ncbi:MAG: helix-turn-helix transcriptional regulator [Alphaproteobacteria bacterium]
MPHRTSKLQLLTLRERDCLRLLAKGKSSNQAAQELGISYSTLSKHLAAVRNKFDVDTTAQAVLLFNQTPDPLDQENRNSLLQEPLNGLGKSSQKLMDLAIKLEGCTSFIEVWGAFLKTTAEIGINQVSFAVITEPPGQLSSGLKMVASTLSENFEEFYFKHSGNNDADAIVGHTVPSANFNLISHDTMLARVRDLKPHSVKAAEELLSDSECLRFLVFHEREKVTGAPLRAVYTIYDEDLQHYKADITGFEEFLSGLTKLFWDIVYRKNFIQEVYKLPPRQIEVLRLAARGYSVNEIAEQIGVSKRSAEKTMASARMNLRVPTTAAAIYRAIIFRII